VVLCFVSMFISPCDLYDNKCTDQKYDTGSAEQVFMGWRSCLGNLVELVHRYFDDDTIHDLTYNRLSHPMWRNQLKNHPIPFIFISLSLTVVYCNGTEWSY
jgi:hypothetical protein